MLEIEGILFKDLHEVFVKCPYLKRFIGYYAGSVTNANDTVTLQSFPSLYARNLLVFRLDGCFVSSQFVIEMLQAPQLWLDNVPTGFHVTYLPGKSQEEFIISNEISKIRALTGKRLT